VLLERLAQAGPIDWRRAYLNARSLAVIRGAQTGANPTGKGKSGSKQHRVVERKGIPLVVNVMAANLHGSHYLGTNFVSPCTCRKNRLYIAPKLSNLGQVQYSPCQSWVEYTITEIR
jgi:hypothetical protein